MAAGNVKHQRKTISTANATTFFWIPICHLLHIKVSANTASKSGMDIDWQLIKNQGADTSQDPSSTDITGDYASFEGNTEGVKFENVQLTTTYLLLVRSNKANTHIEVTTFS